MVSDNPGSLEQIKLPGEKESTDEDQDGGGDSHEDLPVGEDTVESGCWLICELTDGGESFSSLRTDL